MGSNEAFCKAVVGFLMIVFNAYFQMGILPMKGFDADAMGILR